MNYANLAQKTNYIAGSNKFENIPFYLTSLNVPGITLNHPEAGGRASTRLNLSADTFNWSALSFEMLIDEDFEIFKELMALIRTNIQVPDGTFSDFFFDFWIEISNNKGHKVLKLEFSNCRIMSIGDIELNSQDDSTEHTLSFEVVFDYYEIIDNPSYILRDTNYYVVPTGSTSMGG